MRSGPPRQAGGANGSSTTSAVVAAAGELQARPRLRLPAHERECDRPEPGRVGDAREAADLPLAEQQRRARLGESSEPQAAQVAVGPALVVEARDRLLADVAALGEAHRPLVEPRLLRDHRLVEVDAIAWPPALDPQALGGRLADGLGSARAKRRGQRGGVPGRGQQVDAGVGANRQRLDAGERDGGVGVLDGTGVGAGDGGRAGPDQRQQPALDACACASSTRKPTLKRRIMSNRLWSATRSVSSSSSGSPSPPSTASTRRSPSILPLWVRKAAYRPSPASRSASSFVTWPLRNSIASGPLSASLPRSERSSSPQPSRSVR